jgi:acyl-CoA thioester hydrolase
MSAEERAPIPETVRLALSDYRTITTLPVQWGDQDAFGHVNNVIYFRWFESARIDLLNVFESSVTMSGSGLGPILASIKCDYRRQLHFPDTVSIGSRITRVGRSSADIGHAIVSHRQGQFVAEGSSVIVIYDYSAKRVTRIPDDLRVLFEASLTGGKG